MTTNDVPLLGSLKRAIAEGLASESAGRVTGDTFEKMREELRQRHDSEAR